MKVQHLLVVFTAKEQLIRATRTIVIQEASIEALLFAFLVNQLCSFATQAQREPTSVG